MFASAEAIRAAMTSASVRSAFVYARLDRVFTNCIAPRTRPRLTNGTATALRRPSARATSRASSVVSASR